MDCSGEVTFFQEMNTTSLTNRLSGILAARCVLSSLPPIKTKAA